MDVTAEQQANVYMGADVFIIAIQPHRASKAIAIALHRTIQNFTFNPFLFSLINIKRGNLISVSFVAILFYISIVNTPFSYGFGKGNGIE